MNINIKQINDSLIQTECYNDNCPFHCKDEPLGICFAQWDDKRFKDVCSQLIELQKLKFKEVK